MSLEVKLMYIKLPKNNMLLEKKNRMKIKENWVLLGY